MARANTPRPAGVLLGAGLVFVLLAMLALLTDQPSGVFSLALGLAVGLNLATVVMLGEVRKRQRQVPLSTPSREGFLP